MHMSVLCLVVIATGLQLRKANLLVSFSDRTRPS